MSVLGELKREQLKKLDKPELIELVLMMQQQLQALQKQVSQQQQELQSLRDQVSKDSANSSKPPSSDGPRHSIC